ncbi:TPA: abortive infection system antitoxin AbiGi family protein [Photobacterium damselae]
MQALARLIIKMDKMRNRKDIHNHIVHLTKNTSISAEENIVNILVGKKIEARKSHSLFSYHVKNFNGKCSDIGKFRGICNRKFRSVCFTETPISDIKFLTTKRPKNTNVKLTNYGIVFNRRYVIKQGGNPAIYCNGYHRNSLSEALKQKFTTELEKIAKQSQKHWETQLSEFASFWGLFNTMKSNYDYSWEREWRHMSDFSFQIEDVGGILVNNKRLFKSVCDMKNEKLYKTILDYDIPIINPSRISDIEQWTSSC